MIFLCHILKKKNRQGFAHVSFFWEGGNVNHNKVPVDFQIPLGWGGGGTLGVAHFTTTISICHSNYFVKFNKLQAVLFCSAKSAADFRYSLANFVIYKILAFSDLKHNRLDWSLLS